MTVGTFTPLGTFSGGDAPVSNTAPFTFGDGITYLRKLTDLQTAFNNTISTLNANNTILNAFQTAIQNEINAQNDAINKLGASLVSYTVTNTGSDILQLVFQDGSTTNIYNTQGVAGQLDPINTSINTLNSEVSALNTDWSNLDTTVGTKITDTASNIYSALQNQTILFVENPGGVQTAITNLIQTLMNSTTANNAQNAVLDFVRQMAVNDATFTANIKNLIIGWLASFSDSLALALRKQSRLILQMATTQGSDVTQTTATTVQGLSGSFTAEAGVTYKVTLAANVSRNDTTNTPVRIGLYIDNAGVTGFQSIVCGNGQSGDGRFSEMTYDIISGLSAGSHTIEARAYLDSGATGWHINWASVLVEVI